MKISNKKKNRASDLLGQTASQYSVGVVSEIFLEYRRQLDEQACTGKQLQALGHAVLVEHEEIGAAAVYVGRLLVLHAWKPTCLYLLDKPADDVDQGTWRVRNE